MRHFSSLEGIRLQDTWISIGSFDGVHLGHQEIIHFLTQGAHAVGAQAVVITFFPHPAVVLGRQQRPYYLSTPEERAALLAALGVDIVITYPFSLKTSQMTADQFIGLLCEHLDQRQLVVGHDFALGKDRQGTVDILRALGQKYDYQVNIIPAVESNGYVVSSSRIRSFLAAGDVTGVEAMLARPYRLSGKVVPGDGRGRTIGIPTANLEIWSERAIPKSGVYACQALIEDEVKAAITNIGVRPTFIDHPNSLIVETHLLGYQGDLYGKTVNLDFMERLRDEKRFSDAASLVAQIQRDIEQAKTMLS